MVYLLPNARPMRAGPVFTPVSPESNQNPGTWACSPINICWMRDEWVHEFQSPPAGKWRVPACWISSGAGQDWARTSWSSQALVARSWKWGGRRAECREGSSSPWGSHIPASTIHPTVLLLGDSDTLTTCFGFKSMNHWRWNLRPWGQQGRGVELLASPRSYPLSYFIPTSKSNSNSNQKAIHLSLSSSGFT